MQQPRYTSTKPSLLQVVAVVILFVSMISLSIFLALETEMNTKLPSLNNITGNNIPIIYSNPSQKARINDVLNITDKRISSSVSSITTMTYDEIQIHCNVPNKNPIGCIHQTEEDNNTKVTEIFIINEQYWNQSIFNRIPCTSFEEVLVHEFGHAYGYIVGDGSEKFAKMYVRQTYKKWNVC